MQLAIVYFDTVRGPIIKYSIPELMSKTRSNVLEKLLDFSTDQDGFFLHTNQQYEKFLCANYAFKIKSEWARGSQELLMITVIPDDDVKPEIYHDNLKEFALTVKKDQKIFKAFYDPTQKADIEIPKYIKKLKDHLTDCFEQCMRNPEAQKPGNISILGIESVGKTSIINRINGNGFSSNVKPTLGMQIIKSVIDNFSFRVFDVGGQEHIRKDWFNSPDPDAIIFVTDCSASVGLSLEAQQQFTRVMEHYFGKHTKIQLDKSTPVLILGNKADLNPKCREKDIEKILTPKKYNINYKIGCVSALKNEGLEENFKWLVKSFLFKGT
jgi:small GTP-binding protein